MRASSCDEHSEACHRDAPKGPYAFAAVISPILARVRTTFESSPPANTWWRKNAWLACVRIVGCQGPYTPLRTGSSKEPRTCGFGTATETPTIVTTATTCASHSPCQMCLLAQQFRCWRNGPRVPAAQQVASTPPQAAQILRGPARLARQRETHESVWVRGPAQTQAPNRE